MNPTLTDVACAAGVSRSTAGRALSGHPAVSVAAREKVQAAATSLGYRADPAARALRGGTSRLIGLVVTNLVNASIHQVVERVHTLAHDHGFQVLMAVTNGDGRREAEVIEALVDHRVQGLMVMPSGSNQAALRRLSASGPAVVTLIRRARGLPVPLVLNDDRSGAAAATRHLLDLGHRRIAFVGGPSGVHSGRERYLGYALALERAGVDLVPDLVHRGPFEPAWGSSVTEAILGARHPASAMLVGNHEALFGVVQTLAQHQVPVPDRLSLIGFEDAPLFRYWHPSVTVVDTHPTVLAETAFSALLRRMGITDPASGIDPTVFPRSGVPEGPVTVPASLLVRDSTAPPRGRAVTHP